MEEMWNMRVSSTKTSAQPGPSATNQGHHPEKLRSELVDMVSGSQQHVASLSYASSLSSRSPYVASLSQFSQTNLPDLRAYSGWPSQSSSILHGNGGAKSSSWADSPIGQGRDFSSVISRGGTQGSLQAVNDSRVPTAELLTRSSLSFGRREGELGMEGSWHLPSSQWSTESTKQRQQRNQCRSTLFSTNSWDPCKVGVSGPLNSTESGFLSQSQAAPAPVSSRGFRVYCISYVGVPVVGQLGLTDAGRLGVTCSCHGHHMSVAKFSQHSGLHGTNPGEVVFMEGGDTLVQWRKSFFSQYGVKVPEDSVGWEWLDRCPPMEARHGDGKCKAAVSVTRSWQKEVDVPCGRSTPMAKSRTTTQQMWDASLSSWNASTLHAKESIWNTKHGLLSNPGNNGGMLDSRDSVLKSYGQFHKSMVSDLESGNQFFSTSSMHENHHSRASSTFQKMGHVAVSNGHDGHSNCGDPRYNPFTRPQHQVISGSRKEASLLGPSRFSETGQESRMREVDISSSFELRLGQPSQQTQAAGTSFPSMATSSVEHTKSHLFKQVMSKVWDGKLQHNLQQLNSTNLPKFSGIPSHSRDQEGSHQSEHEKSSENLENGVVENCGEERESANSSAISQSPRQLTCNASQVGYREDGVSDLQEKLMSLESLQKQSDISSSSGDHQFGSETYGSEKLAAKLFPQTPVGPSRSVTMENGTTLESLSSEALEQLSKKTGQRLLETAIQSSFTYRAMGLGGSAAGARQLNGVVPRSSRAEGQLFDHLDAYGRSNFVGGHRPSFLEFLVRDQLSQNQSELGYGLAAASADWSTFLAEQDPNLRAFQMQDQPGMIFMKQELHLMQRLVELGRRSDAQQKSQRQSLMTNRNGRDWRSEEQQGTLMGRQGRGRSQGGPEAEGLAHLGLESSKVKNGAMIPRRLAQAHGEGEGKECETLDSQSQPLADMGARSLTTEEGLEVPVLNAGVIQCNCLKCRKASPSVRGQAVPRLAGQVCLKEKARLACTLEAAKKGEGEQNCMKGPAQIEQSDMEVRKCTVDSGHAGEGTPENEEDVLSDTAANRPAAVGGRGTARTAGETRPVCSDSSENVSSGISDGGCVSSEQGGPGVMQGSGETGVLSVVDEGSGVGKCCSSDDVDMKAGGQSNALSSTLVDHSKVEGSPLSGCPSSSNVDGQRLGVKRGGMRSHTWGCHGKSVKELDNEVEGNEPGASTGKLESKKRRNMKWKWLGSGVADDRDAKEGSPGESSYGQEAEPQVTSETARMGSKNVQEVTRPDALKRDLVRSWSGKMLPPSKRRKLLVPRRHQEVKATNVTEENLAAAARSLVDDSSKKKAGTTLVIRVPQGLNRKKATKGIRSKLLQLPKSATRDWKLDSGKEGRVGAEDGRRGSEPGKSTASRAAGSPTEESMEGCGSGSDGAGFIPVPIIVTKSIRSPRTPLGGPSPRNGRMVSLSVILNQPAAASPVPRTLEDSRAFVQQKLRNGVANSISSREGTALHKMSETHVGSVSGVLDGQGKEVKNRGGPSDTGVAWHATEGSRTKVVQNKEDAQSRKVRSMLELIGKNDDVYGPGASSVFEFAEEGDHVAAVPRTTFKQQKTASASVQTDGSLTRPGARPGRLETKPCPFPRGERSARPGVSKKRIVEWHRSGYARAEVVRKISSAGAEKFASEMGGMFVCRVSQVRSSAGSSISREKLLQGVFEQGVPVRKQVRSSKAKRTNVTIGEGLQAKYRGGVPAERVAVAGIQKVRQLQGQVKGGITGYGVLKRRPELSLPGVNAKRPRVVLGLKQMKEGYMDEIEGSMDSGEQLKSFRQRGFCSAQRKTEAMVEDPVADSGKMQKREMPQTMDRNGRGLAWRKERRGEGVQRNQLGQGEKCRCDVCGTFSSASYNKLLCCGRCSVKVHQACYGVPKIPKGPWLCRICKFKVTNPICVLCGYGGGAMTRVQKARPLCQALLQTWRELKNETACVPVLEDDDNDDDETLLSATTSIQLLRARSAGMTAKKSETKVRECESCDCVEPRDEGPVCKVCGKESPEPGSSAGNGVKRSERGAVSSSGREDWRRSNTVGSVVTDAGAKQWAHMVCTLWMPGTRCLNMGTMGVFDVSGVTASRRKALCSICLRKGGACIQCRVPKCSTPFHVWCAHEKGLLQSEIVKDGSNKVGFFGKCLSHAARSSIGSEYVMEDFCPSSGGSCARTEGYKGRLSLEERATAQHNMTLEGATAVTREQVAVWLRISDRKMTARRVLKSTNPAMKFDHREYLRFKQKKGWRKLAVCKSGIHAIGLYTTDFIAEGEVVVEYVGEIVGLRVADKREAEYHSGKRLQYQGACYLFRIDSEQIIDATRKGGIARFVNHSCSPNCVAKVICVDNHKKVIFFAKRDIYAGEEVTYDYKFNYDEVGDKIPCFCSTPECRGTLN